MLEDFVNETLQGYLQCVESSDANEALRYMIVRSMHLKGYRCRPANHGFMNRTLHYYRDGRSLFAFSVTKSGIRFYFQRPDETHPELTLAYLKASFPDANQLKGGDLNAKIENSKDASAIMDIAFGTSEGKRVA